MSLVNTLLQDIWAKYPNPLDKNEVRKSHYGAWDFILQQGNLSNSLLDPDTVMKAMGSMGTTVRVPVLDKSTITISNTRSCTISLEENTSALVQLNFATYGFGFTMTPSAYANNHIGYQADFNRKMEERILKLAATLDTATVNVFETDRNVYFPSHITNYYANVGNALQVAQAEKTDFFNQLSAITREMDYYGSPNVIGSTSLMPMVQRLLNQGAANDENDAFQLLGYKFHNSNRVTNGSGIESTAYIIPDGMVQCVNRNTPDHIMQSNVGDFRVWGEADIPIVGLKMGTYYTADCTDASGENGGGARMAHQTRAKREGFWFDTDVCWVTAYNSDKPNSFNPIIKAEISQS